MMFSYFKFIVANVFMINMQFSKINCNVKVVALQKIVFNNRSRFVPESMNAYQTRNIKKIDERTGLPYSFNVLYKRNKYYFEAMDKNVCYINNDGQLIMNEYQASNNNLHQMYLTTMNVMKQKEVNLAYPTVPRFDYKILFDDQRQLQFYRYLLYPYENENIFQYWDRVDTKLKYCLLNEDRFDFIPSKIQHIDNIRYDKIYVQKIDGETDEEYAFIVQYHHMWFYNMISTKPIIGEGLPNYHLRNIRLGFSSLTTDNIRIFYNEFTENERRHIKIYDIKNNFFDTEFFIMHIIMHCKLPQSEFVEYTEKPVPKKNKRERGESSSSKRVRGMNS